MVNGSNISILYMDILYTDSLSIMDIVCFCITDRDNEEELGEGEV